MSPERLSKLPKIPHQNWNQGLTAPEPKFVTTAQDSLRPGPDLDGGCGGQSGKISRTGEAGAGGLSHPCTLHGGLCGTWVSQAAQLHGTA
jgi:hypothetical protein